MNKFLTLLLLIAFSIPAFAATDESKNGFKQYYKTLKNMELEIAGTGWGHVRTDIPGDEGIEYWCFAGIPMYDKKSRLLVGHANDCLSGVVIDEGAVSVNPGFTFLDFFAPNGDTWTLTVSGNISVQPTTVQTKTAWKLDVTHITGSSKANEDGNNTCVGGSGPFDEARCVSRISGMVNMSELNPADIPGSKLQFSCFFSIENLKLENWAINGAAESL